MSFFRNLRSSISRGKNSSSSDTKSVKASSKSSSRPSSMVSNAASFATDRRRDSIGSHTDSLFNRSETFILDSDENQQNQKQNQKQQKQLEEQEQPDKSISNQDKKSKKSKSNVLSKFSTFTKRKKNPITPTTMVSSKQLGTDGSIYEHHPTDNATNTYYKWNSDGTSSTNLDYDARTDPFNFLYEQHSNLKLLKNEIENPDGRKNSGGSHFDSSTYRKGKATAHLKAQIEQLKTQQQPQPQQQLQQQKEPQRQSSNHNDLAEEDDRETNQESDTNKYKTITLNSFRRSFRDKFLQQQKDAALYNPSWFIEVQPPTKSGDNDDYSSQHDSKENRREYLVFENDNYRPGSRSPVRGDRSISDGRQSRSPVKRNETFRIDRNNAYNNAIRSHPNDDSIHVEFKNSMVMANEPSRRVPIGVAKPMQTNGIYRAASGSAANNTPTINTTRFKIATPQQTITTSSNQPKTHTGKYQTLVQISGDNQGVAIANLTSSPTFIRPSRNRDRNRVNATQIQFGSGPENTSATQKFNNNNNNNGNNVTLRHSYVGAPVQIQGTNPSVGLSSYELIRNSNTNIKPQRLKQTYFGGDLKTGIGSVRQVATPTTYNRLSTPISTRLTNYNNIGTISDSSQFASNGNRLRQQSHNWQAQSLSPKRSTSTMITGSTAPTAGYLSRQPRQAVSTQRRSRSPIKMPWR